MVGFLIRGFLIGLLFGLPVGAVGTMTVQRTLSGGTRAGLVTGLGSSAADCIYACIGVFGLTMISDFLLRYQAAIHLIGGSFILLMGLRLFLKKKTQDGVLHTGKNSGLFLTSFFIGITNPAAILTFLFAFSWFGITGETGAVHGTALVIGVFSGTWCWWMALAFATDFVRKRYGTAEFRCANKIFGTILILFGGVIFIRTFTNL